MSYWSAVRQGALSLALTVLALPTTAVAAAPGTAAPAMAVRRVLDEQVTAWNKGDLEGFMRGYWQSPDLSFYSGSNKTRGWKGTLERYRKRYQSEGQEMGRLSFSEIEVTVIGTDHALVRGRWQLLRKKDKPGGLFTLLFKRLPEGWRIVHDHTSS
jgi:ketosteroid isomerase-like protein